MKIATLTVAVASCGAAALFLALGVVRQYHDRMQVEYACTKWSEKGKYDVDQVCLQFEEVLM